MNQAEQAREASAILPSTIKRRLAAIAFADVAGWSRLIEKNDVDALRAWKALRADVIEPVDRACRRTGWTTIDTNVAV
jgi:hypothetical protein